MYFDVTNYKCSCCGWVYDPSKYENGYQIVPDHLSDSYDRLESCAGALQHPRATTRRRVESKRPHA